MAVLLHKGKQTNEVLGFSEQIKEASDCSARLMVLDGVWKAVWEARGPGEEITHVISHEVTIVTMPCDVLAFMFAYL